MISEQEALARILAAVPPAEQETVPLSAAAGRIAAADVCAHLPLPGFDNSAMDGWAIHAADCGRENARLHISGEQPAGADRGHTLRAGEAVRIFTGAPLPRDTAAVVMQEDAEPHGDTVLIKDHAPSGQFIRRAGSDLCPGQIIVRRGSVLTPAKIGLLASQGLCTTLCGRRPHVAIICTGEELTPPGQPLPHPGALYNSNGPLLAAQLAPATPHTAVDTVPDDLAAITALLRRRLEENDALILSGGVSVGDHDLVRPALAQLGIQPDFWRVSIRPGKPFLFCATSGGKLIFGLPGNPVSAFVTSLLFVLPALRRFAGAADCGHTLLTARAAAPLTNSGDRTHYLRGQWDPARGLFTPTGLQESHALAGLSTANALARLLPGQSIAPGDPVELLPLS